MTEPKQNADIKRVKSMKILGVILNNKPRAADHVRAILNNCSRSLYALRILKAYGLQSQVIHKVTEATLMSRLLYASPSLGITTTRLRTFRLRHFVYRHFVYRHFVYYDFPC